MSRWVMPSAAISWRRPAGSRRSRSPAKRRVPPAHSTCEIPASDESKANEYVPSRIPGASSKRCRRARHWCTRLRWLTSTPLGVPVLPDVYIR